MPRRLLMLPTANPTECAAEIGGLDGISASGIEEEDAQRFWCKKTRSEHEAGRRVDSPGVDKNARANNRRALGQVKTNDRT